MRGGFDNGWAFALAERQGGRVSRAQLLERGVSRWTVDRRITSGLLSSEGHGVLRVGPDVRTRTGRLWRALLAAGEHAALSHPSGAVELDLLERWTGPVHVSVPSTSGRTAPPGVVLHRRRRFGPGDVVQVGGLPVTSPALTLVDLGHTHPHLLGRAINAAERQLLDVGDLRAFARGRPGARALTAALDAYAPAEARTRQELERLALRMLIDHVAPRYEPNALVETQHRTYEVDGLYRAERLVVELQSEAHHATPGERRADRIKANALTAAGFRLIQWDWHDVTRAPQQTVAALLTLLDGR